MSNCTLSIAGLALRTGCESILSDQLLISEADCQNSVLPSGQSVFVDGHTFLLVTDGRVCIRINGQDFTIEASGLIILSPIHLVRLLHIEPGSRCHLLTASKYILKESLSLPYIQLYNHPIIRLSPDECSLLSGCMGRILGSVLRRDHHLHRELVLNSLQLFLIELNNMLTAGHRFDRAAVSDRQNAVFHEFLSLLLLHYREEHNTEFYARRLNMSIHNLGRIIKGVANASPSDIIYEVLFTEARRLLSETDIPVQQISMSLHFSDQSAFGKFFKRKAGISPAEYRKGGR